MLLEIPAVVCMYVNYNLSLLCH